MSLKRYFSLCVAGEAIYVSTPARELVWVKRSVDESVGCTARPAGVLYGSLSTLCSVPATTRRLVEAIGAQSTPSSASRNAPRRGSWTGRPLRFRLKTVPPDLQACRVQQRRSPIALGPHAEQSNS